MTRPRIIETDQGIQGELTVNFYDQMQKRLRDKGWIETKDIIKSGILKGFALEIGPGPGYLGLEWLKNTQGTTLKWVDISPDMISVAKPNAKDYGLSVRVEYVHSSGDTFPFENEIFDAVFTNGSLHEWSNPVNIFNEIWRVLKRGGKFFLSDLTREMVFLIKWFLWINTKPKEIRPGLITSINAAYTPDELKELIKKTTLENCVLSGNPFGLKLTGVKLTVNKRFWRRNDRTIHSGGCVITGRHIKILLSIFRAIFQTGLQNPKRSSYALSIQGKIT